MIDSTTMPVSEEKALEIKFDITEKIIDELKVRHGSLEITDKPSYNALVKAKKEVVHVRTSIEKRRKELNENAQTFISKVNDAAKVLTSLIEPIETGLKTKQKMWNDQQEAAKLKAEKKECKRVETIQTKISDLREKSLILTGKDSSTLQTLLSDIQKIQVTEDVYMEFMAMAGLVKSQVESQVQEALTARLKWEEEEKVRREEFTKLEEMKKENEQIEIKRKAKAEAEAMIRKVSADAEEIARKAEKEKIEAERRTIDAEKARVKAERRELEAEKREIEEKIKSEKEKRQHEYEYLSRTRESELKNISTSIPSESLGSMPQERYSKIYLEHKVEWDKEQERLRLEKKSRQKKEREEFERQAKIKAEREAAESLARQQEVEKAEVKRIEDEKKRQEALRPDKEKLLFFADLLSGIKVSPLSDKRAKSILNEANGMIDNIVDFIKIEIMKL